MAARIQVLARAHEALIAGETELSLVREIVQRSLFPYDADLAARYVFEGPDLALASRPALSMALILHELATIAVKYGALSSAVGRVLVSWDTVGSGDTAQFVSTSARLMGPS